MNKTVAVIAHRWGSTLQNLIDCQIPISPIFLNKASSFDYKKFFPINNQDDVWNIIRESGASLVALAGFRRKLIIPPDFEGRTVNIHPALIPNFSGQGMYGRKVHEKVKESGIKTTGCTVHLVNNEYDSGPILAQSKVKLTGNETVDEIESMVQEVERFLYPRVINYLLNHEGKVDRIPPEIYAR